MVKPSHTRARDDPGPIRRLRFHPSTVWRIADRRVDALGVVVLDVLPKQASQVLLAKHNHVIEKFPPNASDKALRGPVLPGATECCSLGTDAEARDPGGG
jgi:hypothetical protein